MKHLSLVALVLCLAATAVHAQAEADCDKTVPLPQATTVPNVAADCDSEAFYYGIGRAPDYAAARACALRHFAEAGKGPDNPMDGAAMLATLYANGKGVARDYGIAIAYACRIESAAPAEMSGRIAHLAKLKAEGPGKTPFDICDDITSGFMMGFCASRSAAIADVERKAYLATVATSLDAPAQAAFARLRTAETAFANAVSDNEIDMSGTARGEMAIAAQQAHHEAFVTTLKTVLDTKTATAPDGAFTAADRHLCQGDGP